MSQELPTSDGAMRPLPANRAARVDAPAARPLSEATDIAVEGAIRENGHAVPLVAEAPAGIDKESLAKRARFGVIALAIRMVLLQLAIFGGGIVLRRRLDPADFGAFAIAQFALSFLAFFGDAGLGGALIQKKEEPNQRELSTVWFFQLGVSLLVVLVIGLGAPLLVRFWPDMPHDRGVWLFRALSIDLLLTSFRVVPAILMERHLQFGRLAILEVCLSVAFYGSAVVFAYLGLGAMSLAWAVVVQGSVGLIAAFSLRPWRPSAVYDREALRPILRFGATYQVKNVIGFLTSAIAPVYGGRALGQRGLGFVNWASETSLFPLRLVELIGRVSFPLYSRLQEDRDAFAKALGRAIQICATGTLLYVAIVFGLGPTLVHVVFTDKWMPALPLLYVSTAAMSLGFLTPVVATALDALGKPQVTMRLSIFTAILLVTITPLLTIKWGMLGFAVGNAITMVIGNVVAVWIARKITPGVDLRASVIASVVACVATALFARNVLHPHLSGLLGLVFAIAAAVVFFLGFVALFDRQTVRDVLALIAEARASKKSETA